MAKINDNTYVNIIQKEILNGRFDTKEDLIEFLRKSREIVLNDSQFRQELEDSFIKLNDETLGSMEKSLFEFYDKSKNKEVSSLNLENVSSFQVEGKDYIKIQDDDGDITLLDDSLEDDNFVKQFQDRQNKLQAASTLDSEHNKQEVIKDMKEDKVDAKLVSSMDVKVRDLTPEEKIQFASVMRMPNAEDINFLVDTERNIYVNKDTGDIYFVRKTESGALEVRKANEVSATTYTEQINTFDDNLNEKTVDIDTPEEPNFEYMSDSDLEYVYSNKYELLTDEQKSKLQEIMNKRKQNKNLEAQKSNDKVFIKKLNNALNKKYNGFVSIVFLCSITAFIGIGTLMLIITKI